MMSRLGWEGTAAVGWLLSACAFGGKGGRPVAPSKEAKKKRALAFRSNALGLPRPFRTAHSRPKGRDPDEAGKGVPFASLLRNRGTERSKKGARCFGTSS